MTRTTPRTIRPHNAPEHTVRRLLDVWEVLIVEPMKRQPSAYYRDRINKIELRDDLMCLWEIGHGSSAYPVFTAKPPYQPGDVVPLRERWRVYGDDYPIDNGDTSFASCVLAPTPQAAVRCVRELFRVVLPFENGEVMKEPSLAPAFAAVYPILAEAARTVGYALAIHGSMGRDLDVIAVPWTAEAMGPTFLISAICKATGGEQHNSDLRIHGRMSVGILLGCGGFVDLSIMPRMTSSAVRTYSGEDLEQLDL